MLVFVRTLTVLLRGFPVTRALTTGDILLKPVIFRDAIDSQHIVKFELVDVLPQTRILSMYCRYRR
jgi:hypothetical protein